MQITRNIHFSESNSPKISQFAQILFIIFVCLGVYYPSLFGEIISIDDTQLITNLYNTDLDLKSLFFRKHTGTYYRPFLQLTFYLDSKFFGSHEFFMHLHNVFIHTLTAIIVFFLVKKSAEYFSIRMFLYFPFLVSLVFAVHPINTEPVNWISGRTDLLAGMFVSLSLLIILSTKDRCSFLYYMSAGIFYFAGLLSKEVTISFLPVVILLTFYKQNNTKKFSFSDRVFIIAIFCFFTLVYFYMRSGFVVSNDVGVSKLISASHDQPSLWILFRNVMKAIGFYMKKLFIPIPLNFAIISIPTFPYLIMGILVTTIVAILIISFLTNKMNPKLAFFTFWLIFSVFFYLPAVPLVFAKMTWTPFAERYLYISSIGAAIIVAYVFVIILKERYFALLILSLLTFWGIITAERNIVWQKNITLWADTVKKSPNFAAARNDYAIALLKEGRTEEARKQLFVAVQSVQEGSINPESNIAIIDFSNGRINSAMQKLLSILKKQGLKKRDKIKILKKLISFNESILLDNDYKEKKEIYKKLTTYYSEILKLTDSGFYYYRLGQIYIALGEKQKAFESFKEAVKRSPNEYFSAAARKLVRKLEAETNKRDVKSIRGQD